MQTRSALLQEPCHLKKNVSEMTFISLQGMTQCFLLQRLLPFLQEGEVGETRLTLLLQVVYQSAGCNTLGKSIPILALIW